MAIKNLRKNTLLMYCQVCHTILTIAIKDSVFEFTHNYVIRLYVRHVNIKTNRYGSCIRLLHVYVGLTEAPPSMPDRDAVPLTNKVSSGGELVGKGSPDGRRHRIHGEEEAS